MCTEMVASASSLRCAAAAPIGPGTEGAARVLCAIGAFASASMAANAADLQLQLTAGCCPHSTCSDMQSLGCRSAMQAAAALRTELAAALNRPALTCSRSAPQHGERSWLLPVCCVRLAQLHLLSSKRCAGCCPHSTCSDMQSLAKLHLRRWQRMQRTASWLLPSFDLL